MSIEQVSRSERRPVARPNSMIYTLYGDLVHRLRPGPGATPSLRIGSLIRLMGCFGLSEAAVRQAVSRMSRQGWLVAERARYAASARGIARIEGLSPRIYGPVVEWDGRWRMLTYSIAESTREKRDRLRKDLAVLGWAPLAPSTWLSPRDGFDAVREAAESSGVAGALHFFEGIYRGPLSDRELLERCWDIDAIARAYAEFIATYEPRLERERRGGSLSDEDAFIERLWLVHDFRKFAYVDPGLPSTLLPAHWQGTIAARVFRDYYAAIEEKSSRFFTSVTLREGAGDSRPRRR